MNFADFGGNRSAIGVGARGFDDRALVGDGQEAGGEVALVVVRQAARVGQHDERGQVVGEAAEAVGDPRAHAREAGQDEAGVHHVAGRAVDVRLARPSP